MEEVDQYLAGLMELKGVPTHKDVEMWRNTVGVFEETFCGRECIGVFQIYILCHEKDGKTPKC